MSTSAILFAAYFIAGLCFCVVAVASHGKERRSQYFDASDGTAVGAGLLIFIALLWPVWLLGLLARSSDKKL
jgi:hypothetical protein